MVFNYPFREPFPRTFSLAQDPNGSVVSHWLDGCWSIKVPVSFLGDLFAKKYNFCSSCQGIFKWTWGLGPSKLGLGLKIGYFD